MLRFVNQSDFRTSLREFGSDAWAQPYAKILTGSYHIWNEHSNGTPLNIAPPLTKLYGQFDQCWTLDTYTKLYGQFDQCWSLADRELVHANASIKSPSATLSISATVQYGRAKITTQPATLNIRTGASTRHEVSFGIWSNGIILPSATLGISATAGIVGKVKMASPSATLNVHAVQTTLATIKMSLSQAFLLKARSGAYCKYTLASNFSLRISAKTGGVGRLKITTRPASINMRASSPIHGNLKITMPMIRPVARARLKTQLWHHY